MTPKKAIKKIESAFPDHKVKGRLMIIKNEMTLFYIHFIDDRFMNMELDVCIRGHDLDILTRAAFIAFKLVDIEEKLKEWAAERKAHKELNEL